MHQTPFRKDECKFPKRVNRHDHSYPCFFDALPCFLSQHYGVPVESSITATRMKSSCMAGSMKGCERCDISAISGGPWGTCLSMRWQVLLEACLTYNLNSVQNSLVVVIVSCILNIRGASLFPASKPQSKLATRRWAAVSVISETNVSHIMFLVHSHETAIRNV